MENQQHDSQPVILIRPAAIFAFIKISGLMLAATGILLLAWRYFPQLTWISMMIMLFAAYRFAYIRRIKYTITPEYLQVSKGLFFREVDTVELFRIKGAHVAAA
jgi:uncharacterized membrane protein YdbT with pleckstrin-like domain